MTIVIHYNTNKDPDIYFGIDEKTENKIINNLKENWNINRADASQWYGQDKKDYTVHHYDATRRNGR